MDRMPIWDSCRWIVEWKDRKYVEWFGSGNQRMWLLLQGEVPSVWMLMRMVCTEELIREYPGVKWVHHDKAGYILLKRRSVTLGVQKRAGCW